jgi:hypothetical protein
MYLGWRRTSGPGANGDSTTGSNEPTAGTARTIQRTGATRIAYTIIMEDHTTNKEFIFVTRTTADCILIIETTHNGPTFNVQSQTYVAR